MKKIIAVVVIGAAGIYLVNRFVLKAGKKKGCDCEKEKFAAHVPEVTTKEVTAVVTKQELKPQVYPSVVEQEFAVSPVIPAKTLIITKQIPFKTPITMNDMVLKNNKIRYA